MRRIVSRIGAVILMIICLFSMNSIEINAAGTGVNQVKAWPRGPQNVSAESAVVMDLKSGMILYQKNMDAKRYPASITKIMTTLLALENSAPSETVTYSRDAVMNLEIGASNAGIKPGEQMSMEQSLYCVMLPSANEACNGVAEHISGSIRNFVKEMNSRARAIGCTGTHFNNPNGLWQSNHYTTAHDMALIMREAMKNETFRKICNTRRYDLPKNNKRKQVLPMVNHHAMVFSLNYPQYGYEYCIGGKTGYTSKSKATLVTCAKKGDMELVCVVMKTKSAVQGVPNIYTDTIKLFNYCFENYSAFNLSTNYSEALSENSIFTNFSPFYSVSNSGLQFNGEASVILPNGVSLDQTSHRVEFYSEPQVKMGKKCIGKLTYYYNKKEAGGAEIVYNDTTTATLKDSINMSEWFKEAVDAANEEAFPWGTLLTLILVAAVSAGVLAIIVYKIQNAMIKNKNRKSMEKLSKNADRNVLFKDRKKRKR